MSDFKGAIFDLDGTLLDSMDLWEQIDIAFLKKRGIAAPPDYIRAVTPMGFREAAEYTLRRFGLQESVPQILGELNAMCREAYAHDIALKPRAKEFLFSLKRSGARLGVATALDDDLYIPALKHCGILHLFDAFAITREVKHGKAFPDVYLLTAERLHLAPPECMVFEDILMGIQGAKAGGFLTCGVYDPSSSGDWEAICRTANRTMKEFPHAT